MYSNRPQKPLLLLPHTSPSKPLPATSARKSQKPRSVGKALTAARTSPSKPRSVGKALTATSSRMSRNKPRSAAPARKIQGKIPFKRTAARASTHSNTFDKSVLVPKNASKTLKIVESGKYEMGKGAELFYHKKIVPATTKQFNEVPHTIVLSLIMLWTTDQKKTSLVPGVR